MEDDTLARLHGLKSLNDTLAALRDEQTAAYNDANVQLSTAQADHEKQLEDLDPDSLASQLEELEDALTQLRLEIDDVSAQNEAAKLDVQKQSRASRKRPH